MGVYSNAYQGGFLTVFYSSGSKPFSEWDFHIRNGNIKRVMDPELKTLVTDILSNNVTTTFMCCPKGNKTLGIHLPFLVMIVKNLKKYFAFEVTILDDSGWRRRFRVGNFQSCTKVTCTSTVMPIGLADGWNQIQFNLSDFTRKAYNTNLAEVISLKINANIRIKRIYFAARLVPEDELPKDYRLFYPLNRTCGRKKSMEHTTEVGGETNIAPHFSKQQDDTIVPAHEEENLKDFNKATGGEESTRRKSSVSTGSGTKKEPRTSSDIKIRPKSEELVRQFREQAINTLDNEMVVMNEAQSTSSNVGKKSQDLFGTDSQNRDLKQVFTESSDPSALSHYTSMSQSLTPKSNSSEREKISVANISRVYKASNIFFETRDDERVEDDSEQQGNNRENVEE